MGLIRYTITLLAGLSVSGFGSATLPAPKPTSGACDVAAAYAHTVIAEAKNQALVFTTDDGPFVTLLTGGAWWRMEGERPTSATPPPAALVQMLEKQGSPNAVAQCSSVRRLLDSRRIGYGARAVAAVNSSNPDEAFKASIHTISVPVVSADGRQALLASSGASGPLAGGGFLQLLELQSDGTWKVVAFSSLWVS